MIDRKQANLDLIGQLGELHKPWWVEEDVTEKGWCLAFVIDRRYFEGVHGNAARLAVSFGHPIVGPETKQGLLKIPVYPGKFVFGLHVVETRGNKLWVSGQWQEALDAGGCTDAVEAEGKARAILDAIDDEEYAWRVCSPDYEEGPMKVSSVYLLEDFEVLGGEPWDSLQEFPVRVTKLDLTQFTGSANVYRNRGLVYTDGINYLVKRVWAGWLIDAITNLQDDPRIQTNPKLRGFQVWRLKHNDKGASLTCWADTEGEQSPVIAEDIMSNFPEDITFYVENGKLMLPSERQTMSSPAGEGLAQGPREARRDLHGPASGS